MRGAASRNREGEGFRQPDAEGGGVFGAEGDVELGAWFGLPLGGQGVVGPGDVHVHRGLRGDQVEGVAVRHLLDGDLAGGGGRGGGGGAVGEQRRREGGGQEAGADARGAHGHGDDRRAGVAQQFQ